MKYLIILFTLIILAILLSNRPVADNAFKKAGYVGLNAFEYVADQVKH